MKPAKDFGDLGTRGPLAVHHVGREHFVAGKRLGVCVATVSHDFGKGICRRSWAGGGSNQY
eukprot:297386-Lingulodinium_polyedra.AAC.1